MGSVPRFSGRSTGGRRRLVSPRAWVSVYLLGVLLGLPSSLGAFEEWARTFGTPETNDEGHCIGQLADGGFVVGGSGRNRWGGAVRLDSLGQVVWSVHNLPADLWGVDFERLIVNQDQSCVLIGRTSSFETTATTYLHKLSPEGDSVWARRYAFGSVGSRGRDISLTRDGGMVATAFGWGPSAADPTVFVLRLNSQGETLWTRGYGRSDSSPDGLSIVQTRDGGFVIAGGGWIENDFRNFAWLLRLDSMGRQLWWKQFGSDTDDCYFNSVETLSGAPGFVVSGRWAHLDVGDCRPWLARFSENGDPIWSRIYDYTDADEVPTALCPAPDGGWLMVGYRASGIGDCEGLLFRTDQDGVPLWKRIESNLEHGFEDGLAATRGGYVAAGWAMDTGNGWKEYLAVRIKDSGVAGVESRNDHWSHTDWGIQVQCPQFTATGQTAVRFFTSTSTRVTFCVFDLSGRRFREPVSSSYEPGWHSKVLALPARRGPGVWVVRVSFGNRSVSRRIVMLK